MLARVLLLACESHVYPIRLPTIDRRGNDLRGTLMVTGGAPLPKLTGTSASPPYVKYWSSLRFTMHERCCCGCFPITVSIKIFFHDFFLLLIYRTATWVFHNAIEKTSLIISGWSSDPSSATGRWHYPSAFLFLQSRGRVFHAEQSSGCKWTSIFFSLR